MQSNTIPIKTSWSLIVLSLFILLQVGFNYILYTYLKLNYWELLLIDSLNGLLFYSYIFNKRYNFYIHTHDKSIHQKHQDNYSIASMKLLKISYCSPFICLLKIKHLNTKTIVWIPISIDSIPLINYKQLRILSLWQ